MLLALALYALYGRHLMRSWRAAYVVTALVSQYLNVVVLVVQAYQKIPALNAIAPNGNEPAVGITAGNRADRLPVRRLAGVQAVSSAGGYRDGDGPRGVTTASLFDP